MTRYPYRAGLALQLIILLFAAVMLAASVRWDNAAVAAMEPQAKETPENPCEEWGKVGIVAIYKCVDEETGFTFYQNALGFMLAEPY